eukprot:gene21595-25934_t
MRFVKTFEELFFAAPRTVWITTGGHMPRPSQRLLSPAIITEAAIESVDESGDFTMPGLAARLKVRPSSLYNHVSGRAEIVELMRAKLMAGIDVESASGTWSETVAALAAEYRRSYAAHPRLIPLFTAQTVQAGVAFTLYNALAQAFDDGGFDPTETLHAITTVDSFVLGSALDLAAPDVQWARRWQHPGKIPNVPTPPSNSACAY